MTLQISGGQKIYVGQTIKITATFKNNSGVETDPTTITFAHTMPNGVYTEYVYPSASEVSRSSAGVYVLALPIAIEGTHLIRSYSDSTFGAAVNDTFEVENL